MNLLGFNEDIIEHVIILGDRMGFDGDIMVKNIYIYIHITNSLCARMLDTGIPKICVFITGNDDKQWDFGNCKQPELLI